MNRTLIFFLLTLKNAALANKEFIVLDDNTFQRNLIILLYKEGLIQSFSVNKERKIRISLRYPLNKNILKKLKIISTPTKSVFLSYQDIIKIPSKKNLLILSTTGGLFTALMCKKKRLGGKALFIC